MHRVFQAELLELIEDDNGSARSGREHPEGTVKVRRRSSIFGGVPSGFDNWEIAGRADFDLTSKQRLSYVMAYGVRKNVPFTVGTNAVPAVAGVVLPLPYTAGGYATITPVVTDIEHVWQISNSMTNQL